MPKKSRPLGRLKQSILSLLFEVYIERAWELGVWIVRQYKDSGRLRFGALYLSGRAELDLHVARMPLQIDQGEGGQAVFICGYRFWQRAGTGVRRQ